MEKSNMSFFSKWFKKQEESKVGETKEQMLERKVEYQFAQLKSKNDEIDQLKRRLQDEKDNVDRIEADAEKLREELEALKKKDSVKLSDAQAKKQLSSLQKAKLKALEEQLKAAPDGLQGGSMVYDKKTKKTSFVEFKSKTEALALIEKAKKGKIQIVS
jgi:chromosome segregation ATPase